MEQQIVLINEMISENPDATIRDFLDLLNDIESIEAAALAIPLFKYQTRDEKGRFDGNVLVPAFKITSCPR
jgi:hypothetical protein